MIIHTIPLQPASITIKLIAAFKKLDCEIQIHSKYNNNDTLKTLKRAADEFYNNRRYNNNDDNNNKLKSLEDLQKLQKLQRLPKLPIIEDPVLLDNPLPINYLWGIRNIARYIEQKIYMPIMTAHLAELAANDNHIIEFIINNIFNIKNKDIKNKNIILLADYIESRLKNISSDPNIKKYLLLTNTQYNKYQNKFNSAEKEEILLNSTSHPGIIDCFCTAAMMDEDFIIYINNNNKYKHIIKYRKRMMNNRQTTFLETASVDEIRLIKDL